MRIADAQRDVRTTFLGGFAGQLVSAVVWASSAALATWGSTRAGIMALVLGGMFIFPLTLLTLRAMGRPAGLPSGHPMNGLGFQAAIALPLMLPVIAGAALYRVEWFYPAFMVALGAHYLPFVFLYGMRMFGVLAGVLVGAGVALGLYAPPGHPSAAAWLTAAVLLGFAVLGRMLVGREGLREARMGKADAPMGRMRPRA